MAAAPRPKSPPAPPDPCGRHRLQLAVDALHREIGFLESKCVLPQLPLLDLLLQQRRRRLLLLLLQPQEAELLLLLQLLLLLLLLMCGGVNEESVSLPPPQQQLLLLPPSLLLRRRRRRVRKELQLQPAVRVLRAAVRGMLVPLHLPVPVPRRLLLRVPGVQVLLRRPSLLPPLLVIERSSEAALIG
uniref:Uncharacterized protein n=1 Tax=Oryza meridionalis TaxID=40149 RepID=A0A0E0D1Z3_9ORYZ